MNENALEESLAFCATEEFEGLRLDVCLAKWLPEHSRARLKRWIQEGLVRVDGQTAVAPDAKLAAGDEVEIAIPDLADATDASRAKPQNIPIHIIYEDGDILVVNKQAGLTVHPGAGAPDGTLMNALLFHDASLSRLPRAGIVHRLDKDTTGLMVVAKSLTAHTELVRALATREIHRGYLALAWGDFAEDDAVIDAPIGRHPSIRIKMAVTRRGKPARTHVHVEQRFGYATLLRCQLETGRTHQIRVHLASVGFPLVGDPVYGQKNKMRAGAPASFFSFPRQALHATSLKFNHPASGKPLAFHAKLPEDFAELLG